MSKSIDVSFGTNTREFAGNLFVDNDYDTLIELIAELEEIAGDMEFTRRLYVLAVDRLTAWES